MGKPGRQREELPKHPSTRSYPADPGSKVAWHFAVLPPQDGPPPSNHTYNCDLHPFPPALTLMLAPPAATPHSARKVRDEGLQEDRAAHGREEPLEGVHAASVGPSCRVLTFRARPSCSSSFSSTHATHKHSQGAQHSAWGTAFGAERGLYTCWHAQHPRLAPPGHGGSWRARGTREGGGVGRGSGPTPLPAPSAACRRGLPSTQ